MTDPKNNGGDSIAASIMAFIDDLANQRAKPFSPDIRGTEDGEAPLLLVHKDYKVEALEQHLQQPLRIKEHCTFQDMSSFVEYVNRHKSDASVVFIDTKGPKVSAVLDYHGVDGNASWCDHVADYAFPTTPEWSEWMAENKKPKTQMELGFFIEDHLEQIASPPAANLLELVLSMKEVRTVSFGSAVALQNGMVRFNYTEDGVKGGAGNLVVPQLIRLGIAPFVDGPTYPLDARMRYRCADGKLSLWYELVRPERVLEAAVKDLEAAVKDVRATVAEHTKLPVFAGQR